MGILVWLIQVNPTPLYIWKSEILGIFSNSKNQKNPKNNKQKLRPGWESKEEY